ncbi:hypothetical protein SAMN06269185_0776 [Natronoarchaeum philippinense]|uniref:CHAT domain-containing protein n=1 Tax=Natronoarchaeum philippinense TaxID=558529 RepID=A0A285NAX7_NATPI|nr:hypothetical protein [Natronoarchaeum philippinense]SNZ05116.1 hypothetical protein SAMN06269185_0776 [Natronoarchaeum philippinense]
MIEWEVTGSGLRVLGADSAEIAVRSPDLHLARSEADLPRPVDSALVCSASELVFPPAVVYATPLSGGQTHELGPDTDPIALPTDEYVIDVDAEIKTYLRVDGELSIRRTDDYDCTVVSFPDRTDVTVGFRSRSEVPTHSLTVPPTPEGVATALSHLHASHRTTGVDRSYPSLRGHPPRIETGEEVAVPDAVVAATPSTGIEIVAPDDLASLFVLAPLSYYLQASVDVADRPRPALRLPSLDAEWELSGLPDLEREVTRLLRQVFFLDCLVRNVGPYGTNLSEASLLDALGLDAGALYDAAPAERLATYMSVAHEAIQHRLPDWHLSTYVEPTPEHLSTLPHLLDRLSLIYAPRTSELEGSELVARSLDDFYRGSTGRAAGDVASVDIVKPELQSGRIHGWLAEGTPIDVFKSTPAAYENRLEYLDRSDDGIDIAVVLNDDEMADEHADVAEIYRQRGEDLPIDVTVAEQLSTAELARLFESRRDFVHYIGHCEQSGLRCPDGYMSSSSIDTCRAQTFFLNACGSYYEGRELVERGSVAGAITFSQVLNDHAVKVGSAFARLLVHGFGIERALQLARRRIMMGKDYAVVGDGTHSLTQSENRLPATAELERVDGDQFLLSYDQFSSHHVGAFYHPFLDDAEYSYLCGTESEHALPRGRLLEYLDRAEMPVIYDGDVYWSSDLRARLEVQ